jgi:hypothetical protein
MVSLDYHLSDRDQFRMRWVHTKIDSINTTAVSIPTFFTPIIQKNHLASAAYFRNFTPNLTNELRFAWNRKEDDRPVNPDWQFAGLDVQPNIQIADISMQIGPNPNYPQGGRYGTYQLVDNVNWVFGSHTLKFGYDGRKVNASNFFVQRARGDYQYQSLERYLRDITPEFAQRSGGGFPFIGNMTSHYLFVNDEWRIRPNFTLNLGLRYERVGVPVGTQSQSVNALASVPGLLEFAAPQPTTKDFAPRVGIAWSPGTAGRTAIRAGFGMAYDQFYQNLGLNALPPQYFTTIDAHVDQPNQPGFLAGGGIPAQDRGDHGSCDCAPADVLLYPERSEPSLLFAVERRCVAGICRRLHRGSPLFGYAWRASARSVAVEPSRSRKPVRSGATDLLRTAVASATRCVDAHAGGLPAPSASTDHGGICQHNNLVYTAGQLYVPWVGNTVHSPLFGRLAVHRSLYMEQEHRR